MMLMPVICLSCHHTGAIDSARLPRILTCVRCGHSEQFEAPPPNWPHTWATRSRAGAAASLRDGRACPLTVVNITASSMTAFWLSVGHSGKVS